MVALRLAERVRLRLAPARERHGPRLALLKARLRACGASLHLAALIQARLSIAGLRHVAERAAAARAARREAAGASLRCMPKHRRSGAGAHVRGFIQSLAGAVGAIAAAGLRSPSARFGLRMSAKLGAGALGLGLAAVLVPFSMELAESCATAGVERVSTPALRGDASGSEGPRESLSAALARRDIASTGSVAEWQRIQKPVAIFGLGAQDFANQSHRYESWRHSSGGRDDRLIYGALVQPRPDPGKPNADKAAQPKPAPYLHLSFLREGAAPRSLFLDLVAQGAQTGVAVERLRQPSLITTKFGAVETADATLSQQTPHGQVLRACLGFRHVSGETSLRIAGWWCAADGRPADRRQLACLIDRIALLSAGEDRELRAVFTQAEKTRDPACNPARIAHIGRKTSWLDADAPAPALRSATLSPTKR
jgi:hypothetical protein